MVSFRILGSVQALVDGHQVSLGGRRQLTLLAFLLVNANRALSTDALTETVWGPARPAGDNRLQMAITRLRKALEPLNPPDGRRLRTVSGGYVLALEPDELDAELFARGVQAGRSALDARDPARAAEQLASALSLWRGPPLADVSFEDFAQPEIRRLEELHLTALETLIDSKLELGRHTELIGELEALVAEHPTREHLAGQLMVALYRAGRQADALEIYQRIRAHLASELGLEPGPALQALQTDVLRHAPELVATNLAGDLDESAPRSRGASVRPTNLPTQTGTLIGREREREMLADVLGGDSGSIVTLTGIGGTGKTRLAVAVGTELLGQFPGGVFLVRLAGVNDPSSIVPMIAEAVGVTGQSNLPLIRTLTDRLGETATLIILDNFEQLASGAAVVSELAERSRALRTLVTSQVALRVSAERTVPLGPLALDDAVALFVERARRVVPGFDPDETQMTAISEICARVDAMPLAIELAAARARSLDPAELARRLAQPLGLLTGGQRDAPERQRSLRATIDWTYALLGSDAQLLFARLGVCAGAVPLSAIEALAADDRATATLDAVEELLAFSFIWRQEDSRLGVRFRVPQALREYALERLTETSEEASVRRAHAEYVWSVAYAARLWKWGAGTQQRSGLGAVSQEIRPAVAWARAHDPGLHVRICSALSSYWIFAGVLPEVAEELRQGRNARVGSAADRAWLVTLLAKAEQMMGDHTRAQELMAVATAEWSQVDDEHERALGLGPLSWVLRWEGQHEDAIALARESLEILRRSGDWRLELRGLVFLAHALANSGDADATEEVLREATRLARGDPLWELTPIYADCAQLRGDHFAALSLYAESLAWAISAGESHQIMMDMRDVATSLAGIGEYDQALEVHELIILEERRTGRVGTMPNAFQWLADAIGTARHAVTAEVASRATARAADVAVAHRASRVLELARTSAAHIPVRDRA